MTPRQSLDGVLAKERRNVVLPALGVPVAVVIRGEVPVTSRTVEVLHFGIGLQDAVVLRPRFLLHRENRVVHQKNIHLNV